ncbi:PREDICTED: lipopolysaccharide-induced tumor necrosis factor-alpha factor homolog [Rhagoletis zephyria]|uniref:lipopolysaccharide-induced tumor necrosis factor-alpha factor homolog n=1 Tax=Rhagoletis zephyria TaxID=28612 RepID=UPI00081176BC|nr:PREDICTED: lipopolysaccharide-induced tumor necrosis factor-alpha factor homolog [Rhagoletis zephyria]
MAFNKQPYTEMHNELLQSNLNGGTAPPPPAYIQSENVAARPTAASAVPLNITEPIPTYTTIYTNPNPPVGPKSTKLRCPQCKCMVETKVRHRSTTKTHLACLLLSWSCICCCLPYCMDTCRNANHFCPMCGTFLGTYQS